MKEIQLRTTSSLRALLNTEPLLPIIDTGIQKERTGKESLHVKSTGAADIRAISQFKDVMKVRIISVVKYVLYMTAV